MAKWAPCSRVSSSARSLGQADGLSGLVQVGHLPGERAGALVRRDVS